MALYASALTAGTNNFQTNPEHINGPLTDFVNVGIVGAIAATAGVAPTTGGFAINAAGTPNATVIVGSGVLYALATPTGQLSQVLRIRSTDNVTVSISTNTSGVTVYDFVYAKVDATNAANPNTAGDNVVTIVTSRSSVSTADDGVTKPAYGLVLAVVTVANSFVTITNGNITDKRVQADPIPAGSVGTTELAADSVTPAKLSKKMIVVNGQLAGTIAANAWGQVSVTFPSGQSLSGYTVVASAFGEFNTGGQGAARQQIGPAYPINNTSFGLWCYNGYSTPLTFYVSYIAQQVT